MKKLLLRSMVVLLFFFLICPMAFLGAQDDGKEYRIKDIDMRSVNLPSGGPSRPPTTSAPSSMGRDWLQLLITYEAKPKRPAGTPRELELTDEISLNIIVGIEDPAKKNAAGGTWYNKYSFLTATVSQVNVFDGNDHYAILYLHPNVVKRFGGEAALTARGAGGKCFVLVELMVNGIRRHAKSTDDNVLKDVAWKQQVAPLEGMLLPKEQSPWAPYYWDIFEMSKPPGKR